MGKIIVFAVVILCLAVAAWFGLSQFVYKAPEEVANRTSTPDPELLAVPEHALGCEAAPEGAAPGLPRVIQPWATLACIDKTQIIFPTAGEGAAYLWFRDGDLFMLPSRIGAAPETEWAYFNYVALRPLVDDLRTEAENLLATHSGHKDLAFDTAWQLALRTNSDIAFDFYFYETNDVPVALLVCSNDCAQALDIEIDTVQAQDEQR